MISTFLHLSETKVETSKDSRSQKSALRNMPMYLKTGKIDRVYGNISNSNGSLKMLVLFKKKVEIKEMTMTLD